MYICMCMSTYVCMNVDWMFIWTLLCVQLVDAVGSHAVHFVGSMELFLKHLADKDSEVRNNAAFAVGVLAANAASALEV